MNLFNHLNKIEKLHTLIIEKQTGSSIQCANLLGIKRTSLYVLIDELSSLHFPVAYSRKHQSFYYRKESKLMTGAKLETV